MKYNAKTVKKASYELENRRKKAEKEAQARKSEFIEKYPQLREIEENMASIGTDAIKSAFDCNDPKLYFEKLKRKSIDFQAARDALFKSAGVDKDYFLPQYDCKKCNDTGYVNGKICDCFENLLKSLSYNELAQQTPLKISSFDDFDVSLYNDENARKRMSDILRYCKAYSKDFDHSSPNIFMFGETGLGKTHLSLAIAGAVIEKGYGVVYGSAQNLLTTIERERFGRSEEPDGTTEEKLLNCDLLILDDLGSEFTTQFVVAELYNIVDSRLAKGLPTIINSNIPLEQLEGRYSIRITSRIIGSYTLMQFFGNDIRQVKLLR